GRALLPRPGQLRPGGRRVGTHARRRPGPLPGRAPARAAPGSRDRHHRARFHAPRGVPARGPRPEGTAMTLNDDGSLLRVRDLAVTFGTGRRATPSRAVDEVSI